MLRDDKEKHKAALEEDLVEQRSATPGTRAKSGTPEGLAWHAKRFHAQANFKLLTFNKFAFKSLSDLQCCGLKRHSIIEFIF